VWDNVAGAFEESQVADPDVLAVDVFFVVQGGMLYDYAANDDRL
jgi:hypothetical protein